VAALFIPALVSIISRSQSTIPAEKESRTKGFPLVTRSVEVLSDKAGTFGRFAQDDRREEMGRLPMEVRARSTGEAPIVPKE
jgi:hypothetical protein